MMKSQHFKRKKTQKKKKKKEEEENPTIKEATAQKQQM